MQPYPEPFSEFIPGIHHVGTHVFLTSKESWNVIFQFVFSITLLLQHFKVVKLLTQDFMKWFHQFFSQRKLINH